MTRERALDIGCGTGTHTIWLAEMGLSVTGLDESTAMLEAAAAKTSGTDLDLDRRAAEHPEGEKQVLQADGAGFFAVAR